MNKPGGERLTMKRLSGEMDVLRDQIRDLQSQLERKLEHSLEKATEMLKARSSDSTRRSSGGQALDADTRREMIAQRAYLRAESRGFSGGNAEQDWLDAEAEVNRELMR